MFIAVVPDFVLDNHYGNLLDGVQAGSIQVKFSKYDRNSLNGYIPRNKKLFTYPYSFLYVSNNQGKSAEYRYEDFKMVTGDEAYDATFYVLGNISPNPKVMIAPYGYRNYDLVNTEYGLTMEGYPLCSWNNDLFAGWLAQNSLTWGVGTVASMGAVIGGVASGNPTVAMGGAFGTFNQLQQLHKEAIQPNQAGGNINNGSLNLTWNKQNFYLMDMSVKYQYAKIIDNYFQMYGYKANVVKIPNVKARNKFTYVQTIDCLITGNIPDEDLNRMKTMFNNGVTFWTNAVYIGMYNSENDPLT
jgi:hypothetical protein